MAVDGETNGLSGLLPEHERVILVGKHSGIDSESRSFVQNRLVYGDRSLVGNAKAQVDVAEAFLRNAKAQVDVAEAFLRNAKAQVDVAIPQVDVAEAFLRNAKA
ncbi:MAG: hypothetical protein KME13_18630 [Myxacorys californica WJT36-NPBG1]|nr:hypothetical protein [Myxacorys californica WJT36-NPBG1]